MFAQVQRPNRAGRHEAAAVRGGVRRRREAVCAGAVERADAHLDARGDLGHGARAHEGDGRGLPRCGTW